MGIHDGSISVASLVIVVSFIFGSVVQTDTVTHTDADERSRLVSKYGDATVS